MGFAWGNGVTCDVTTSQVLQFRAVLWEPRNGVTRELPPFPGDSTSAATAINEQGLVVGISGDAVCTAILWQIEER